MHEDILHHREQTEMIYTYDIYEREPKIVRQYYRQHKKIFSNTYQSTSVVYSIG